MCGCKDRGRLIKVAAQQALRGNFTGAARRLGAVGVSAGQSAANGVRAIVSRPANPQRTHELGRLKASRRF
jgi:hypothetical protein